MGMGMPMGGEDFVTIIMGLDDPCEPGMHGKLEEPCPTEDAVTLVTKIRDMCDKWLRSAGKGAGEETAEQQPTEVGDISGEE